MDKKDREILLKIRQHAAEIIEETADINSALQFRTENKSKEALFDLLQIGELAGNQLSAEAIAEITTIPWNQIYALRNRIVHGYAYVDFQIVWETITDDIPELIEELDNILNKQ